MLDQFLGRRPGDHAYLECTLVTDLSNGWENEEIPGHKQVDVRLPNNKLLRLPYAWLRGEGGGAASMVLDEMLDASEEVEVVAHDAIAKKVAVKRAPPK